ncbi:MAG: sodium-dependent transporter [Bryobacterales bacterium]|nr:sodium-dependent transporter [Bryobacterales bacterium]
MAQARFGSRWAMMLAMLGMAVGTGNIWRFPRIAAKNGGGEFLVAWIAFLFLWSIPLILLEFGMGRKTRSGPVRAFVSMAGPGWAWTGAMVVCVCTGILCYYSVVAGWTARYAVAAFGGELAAAVPGAFWTDFTSSAWPAACHAVMLTLAVVVVAKGVTAIERVAKVLMPALIALVFVLVVRAATLPGAGEGLAYLFGIDWGQLTRAQIWIEALTQNAWDTGAGWGLVLCFAAYQRDREDTALNSFVLPAANNTISLLAGIMVICTVFSAVPALLERAATDPSQLRGLGSLEQAVREGQQFSARLMQDTVFSEDNAGITFIWMPELFRSLPHGRLFMALFFAALAFAAFTSLIAMVEVAVRALGDAGFDRRKAVVGVGAAGFLVGLPSALSLGVLDNQDWVWSVALILSGLFFALAVGRYGVRRFREETLNHEHSDVRIGSWWDFVIRAVVPFEAVVLTTWLLYQAWRDDPAGWFVPFGADHVFSVGTVLVQVGVVALVLLLLNRKLAASVRVGGFPT